MKGTAICRVNFRRTPEISDNIIAELEEGQKINIKEIAEDWLKVTVNRKLGYIMTEFVEIDGEIDADGNFAVDGEVIGKVDGDNITITDPEVIKETLEDIEKEAESNE
ncbi:MAG: hypothetical protein ACI4S2_12410 [Lachnospiraceae bacterium]